MERVGRPIPGAAWKQARLDSFRRAEAGVTLSRWPPSCAAGLAVRQAEPWADLGSLSATFIPFRVELTCYYYSFIIVVALLCVKSERLASGCCCSRVTPVRGLGTDQRYATLLDEKYTLMSVATLIAFVAITWEFFSKRRLAPQQAQPRLPLPPTGQKRNRPEQEKPGKERAAAVTVVTGGVATSNRLPKDCRCGSALARAAGPSEWRPPCRSVPCHR